MGKRLIIAEKPNLALIIIKGLYKENWQKKDDYFEGTNFICSSCFGHLFELYEVDDYFGREKTKWNLEELPFVPSEYKFKIINNDGVKKRLNLLEKLIMRNDVTGIIHAGDPDAEGQKIVNDVIDYCFDKNKIKKKVERLWFSAENEISVRSDIQKMRDNEEYKNYFNQSLARTKIDYLVGINYSRELSLIASQNGGKILLAQGRVLGCIVKYIYDRYIEQQNFIPKNYTNIGFVMNDKDKTMLILKNSIFEEEEEYKALEIVNRLNCSNTYIKSIEEKQINKLPNNLFSLTKLQNKMSKMKISTNDTLDYVQKLYEKGFLTYPRAKSEYLAETEKENVNKVIEVFRQQGITNISFRDSKHIFDSSKVGNNHSAIIPTTKLPKEDELKGPEKLIYDTIKNRFLANFCEEKCIVNQTRITIANSDSEIDMTAEMRGLKVIQKGFLVFENTLEEKFLPNFKKGERLEGEYQLNYCVTKAPANVTPTELNDFMESPFKKNDESEEERYKKILEGLEIGTPATRSKIVENAKKYDYIIEEKGVYTITPKGIFFIKTAEKLGLLMTKEETATLGVKLQSVLDKKITENQCVDIIERDVIKKVNAAKNITVPGYVVEVEEIGICPICGKKILESNKSFYCEGIKDKSCNFSLFKKDNFLSLRGKTLTATLAKKLLKNKTAKVSLKKKDGSKYDANITYKKNGNYYNIDFAERSTTGDNNTTDKSIGTCPRCGKPVLKGDKGYYCSGYKDTPKCGFTIWKKNKYLDGRGIKLSESNIKKLINKEQILVKNIKKKDGNGTYSAYISLDDTGTFVNYKITLAKGGIK